MSYSTLPRAGLEAAIASAANNIGVKYLCLEVFNFKRKLEASFNFDTSGKTGGIITVNLPISFGEYEWHSEITPIQPVIDEFVRKISSKEFDKQENSL